MRLNQVAIGSNDLDASEAFCRTLGSDQIDGDSDRLTGAGVEFDQPPTDMPWHPPWRLPAP